MKKYKDRAPVDPVRRLFQRVNLWGREITALACLLTGLTIVFFRLDF